MSGVQRLEFVVQLNQRDERVVVRAGGVTVSCKATVVVVEARVVSQLESSHEALRKGLVDRSGHRQQLVVIGARDAVVADRVLSSSVRIDVVCLLCLE